MRVGHVDDRAHGAVAGALHHREGVPAADRLEGLHNRAPLGLVRGLSVDIVLRVAPEQSVGRPSSRAHIHMDKDKARQDEQKEE